PSTISLPVSALVGFSSQLFQAKVALATGYTAAGALFLGLLFLIWNLLKQPISAVFAFLAGPLIRLIEALVAKLEAMVRNKP
ncbi:hypothetical protein MXD81_26515, partial [Microbacteriaceae bacterium K1510]|nr:hypothetical protein [Microbacteriaceae bacterium K1510]